MISLMTNQVKQSHEARNCPGLGLRLSVWGSRGVTVLIPDRRTAAAAGEVAAAQKHGRQLC